MCFGYNVPAGESDKLARIWVELFLSSAQVFLQRQLPQPYGATLMKSALDTIFSVGLQGRPADPRRGQGEHIQGSETKIQP